MGRRKGRRTTKGNSERNRSGEGAVARTAEKKEETTDAPIDVYARLTYPLVSMDAEEQEEEQEEEQDEASEEEEECVKLSIRPRFVFVSNLCAVCLETSRVICEGCRMVSYCSKAHRSKGLACHSELCEPLAAIRSSIVSRASDEMNADQYRAYRVQLLGFLRSKVSRPLELWETEIVLYPAICRSCRRFSEKSISCGRCAMETYCEKHAAEHSKWCKQFECLRRCLSSQLKYGCANPAIPNAREERRVARPDLGFDQLMRRVYTDRFAYYRRMDCYTYASLSHAATIPLTALYATQIAFPLWQVQTDWTIHLLGAEFHFEGLNLHLWEKLFLHSMPNLKSVRLALIGPELRLPSGVTTRALSKVKLCEECKSLGRTVIVRFRPGTLYHELPESELLEPDVICAFNPGLYRTTGFDGRDSWFETIREFCKRSKPVAITSYTVDEMHWEMDRIKSIADVEVLLEPRRNPFASIKPDRNFVTDHDNPLIYKNYYISIVKGKPTLPAIS